MKDVKPFVNKATKELLNKNNLGIKLDIGCGANKQPKFVGIDIRKGEGVDIVHDLELYPWPLPDECASFAFSSHVVEHINPHKGDARIKPLIELLLKKKVVTEKEIRETIGEYEGYPSFMRFMDEVWRIMKYDGEFVIGAPYAGSSGFWQDPTHINGVNENTFAYFDPCDISGLFNIYRPKPWKIVSNNGNVNGSIEVVLRKRRIHKSYKVDNEKTYDIKA